LIESGRVGRPHGLDGSFYVTRPEASLIGDLVTVDGVQRRVLRRAGTDAKPLLRLEGIDTREAVVALRGLPLLVARETAPPLEPDEYWAEDLVGLAVVDGDRPVGVVGRVRSLPSCEVLEVGELLIPLVSDAVRDVDLEAGRIDVDLGFLGAG
jgi:16S rRNA processing protein RimM